jgi:protein-L-isoaspartate O-methyltransferase
MTFPEMTRGLISRAKRQGNLLVPVKRELPDGVFAVPGTDDNDWRLETGGLLLSVCQETPQELLRDETLSVNKALMAIGGVWSAKDQGFLFPITDAELDARLEQLILTGEPEGGIEQGYLPTREPLAGRALHLARLAPGLSVLEPSAGRGALADLAAEVVGLENVTSVEREAEFCRTLGEKGYPAVFQEDFLAIPPSPDWDRVLMTPPFWGQKDIDHVKHAFACLKPGGLLVAIISASALYREDAKSRSFYRLLEDHGGTCERNPQGMFSSGGFDVPTVTIVLHKA